MVCGNEKTFHTSRTLRVLCMLGSAEHQQRFQPQSKTDVPMGRPNQAVDLTKAGTNAGDAARKEKDRLVPMTSTV
jgi:hypothetical protein